MPLFKSKLNNNQSEIMKQTLKCLEKHRSMGPEVAKEIQSFKDKLNSSNSPQAFYSINDALIKYGESLAVKLFPQGQNFPDKLTMKALHKQLEDDPELSAILDGIDYVSTFLKETLENKEKLTLEGLKHGLNEQQFKALVDCIHNIKSIIPTAISIDTQVSQFREELERATSLEEVQDIESQIAIIHNALNIMYQKTIEFPQDEVVAGALVQFLYSNFHLLDKMRSFNIHGNLTDDILYAEANLQNRTTPS